MRFAFRHDSRSLIEVRTASPSFHRWYNGERQRLAIALLGVTRSEQQTLASSLEGICGAVPGLYNDPLSYCLLLPDDISLNLLKKTS